MNLSSIRWKLTLGYVGIFSLLLLLLGLFAVFGFSRELVLQQDELLAQEARNTTKNILEGNKSEVLAAKSAEFGWIALDRDGDVMDRNQTTTSLGLPSEDLFWKTLKGEEMVVATVQGANGDARVVSMPMYESGEMVGVMQYARSLRRVQQTVGELVLVLLPLGLGALGLAAVGGLYMAGRAVRPVREAFDRQRAFIADASHELKTPLTLVRVDTEVLQSNLENPDDRELADEVLAETDRMDVILSDLLTMARLDANVLDVARKPFDLSYLIKEEAERFNLRASREGVRLEVRAPDELLASGDPARTRQILAALLDNALRFTPSGGSVEVSAREQDGRVEAIVSDSGSGIPPEHLTRIFERFYRAEAVPGGADGGGTGIGLAIAKGLARAQEGDLEAENAKDSGAVFRLKL
ncbi:MAG: Histidine kinase, gyrase and HSP90-like ATPase, partial [Rubrobacteraceae bacterium]|nr:Histidine kinase, gyrase and HSP90-like ATPase [Rubrobacteraceae bacterium]